MNADPAPDLADLAQLRRGDDHALERLVARWEDRLFAFAWRYLHNATDARELVIEVFVRLHQQRERLHAETNLSAWLFTTMANLCHNQHRWRQRHPAVEFDDTFAADLSTAPQNAPLTQLERTEELQALASALDGLSHKQKAALLLHHYGGWSYRQIAATVGGSERGVETLIYRARQQLQRELTPMLREAPLP